MKNSELLEDALGKIDDDLLFDAETVRRQKPRRPFAFFVAAACLTVMLLAIPIGIVIANQNETPKVPTTSTLFTTKAEIPVTAPRSSLLDLPGALPFDENDNTFQQLGANTHPDPSDRTLSKEWLEEIKQTNTVVMGKVTEHMSVLVPDGDGYYRVTTMKIKVLQDISGVGKDTVTAVYACRYKPDSSHYIPDTDQNGTYTADMFKSYLLHTEQSANSQSVGIFILNKAENNTITINETSYKLSEYADSVMDACLLYRIGSDTAQLPGGAYTIDLHLMEEVFGITLPSDSAKPNPTYDRDAIDILKGPEPYKAIVKNQDGTFFTIEKHDIDNHPALIIRMDSESDPFNEFFIQTEGSDKREPSPHYAWAVVIDGRLYDIEPCLLVNTSTETLVLLNLGENVKSDESFETLILGIYNKFATPYSFDYYANLTQ